MKTGKTAQRERFSDEIVNARTGKTWSSWFKILDAAGARTMSHREIVAYLTDRHAVGSWWRQMITVTYERARGKREKHQTPAGFEISRSRTLAADASAVFRAWKDAPVRSRWLREKDIVVQKATPVKSIRLRWRNPTANVVVNIYAKGVGKSQVVVQQLKMKSTAEANRMKRYWEKALDRLRRHIED